MNSFVERDLTENFEASSAKATRKLPLMLQHTKDTTLRETEKLDGLIKNYEDLFQLQGAKDAELLRA